MFRLILLNKLLEDGNKLFRNGKFEDASYRYEYALKRLPKLRPCNTTHDKTNSKSSIRDGTADGTTNIRDSQNEDVFLQLKIHLLLNLSRTKRKQKVGGLLID